MGSVVADIRKVIAEKVDLPAGYSISIGGQFESQERAQKRLSIVVPLSLALIALLLYFAFGSVGQAMLILVNVPLAVIGGVFFIVLIGTIPICTKLCRFYYLIRRRSIKRCCHGGKY